MSRENGQVVPPAEKADRWAQWRAKRAIEGKPEGGPHQVIEEVRQVLAEAHTPKPGIAARLWRKFGGGENPQKRRELYARLEMLAIGREDLVHQVITEAVAQAVGARDPGRYFTRAVTRKLIEAGLGLGPRPGGDPSW